MTIAQVSIQLCSERTSEFQTMSNNAEELADAIIREVELKEAWLTRVLGNSADPDASVGKWDRRLAQCGGIDEMSSGVQATYFSPNGQLVGLVAYIDAEWMDE